MEVVVADVRAAVVVVDVAAGVVDVTVEAVAVDATAAVAEGGIRLLPRICTDSTDKSRRTAEIAVLFSLCTAGRFRGAPRES